MNANAATISTFVSLRITGDRLDPDEITRLLRIVPTVAYAKGERYFAGERTGTLIGKTGLWLFSTDRGISSPDFSDHLHTLVGLLALDHFDELLRESPRKKATPAKSAPLPQFLLRGRLKNLHGLLERKSLAASMNCFWHGAADARAPSIPRFVTGLFKLIPIAIETDFETENEMSPGDPPLRASA